MNPRRRALTIAVVSASWVALVATSPRRWTVRQFTTVAAFELESGRQQSFRVTLRPSLAASTNGHASTRLDATASSQVVGSPRPATVTVQIDPGNSASRPLPLSHGAQLNDSIACTAAACAQTYTIRAIWPDGPPGARARVTITLQAEARGIGQQPNGASIAIDVVPAP